MIVGTRLGGRDCGVVTGGGATSRKGLVRGWRCRWFFRGGLPDFLLTFAAAVGDGADLISVETTRRGIRRRPRPGRTRRSDGCSTQRRKETPRGRRAAASASPVEASTDLPLLISANDIGQRVLSREYGVGSPLNRFSSAAAACGGYAAGSPGQEDRETEPHGSCGTVRPRAHRWAKGGLDRPEDGDFSTSSHCSPEIVNCACCRELTRPARAAASNARSWDNWGSAASFSKTTSSSAKLCAAMEATSCQ